MSNHSFEDVHWPSADGLRLHARAYGAVCVPGRVRCPVICIPGLTRNSADFHELALDIAGRGRQVWSVDLRGRAGSERAREPRGYNPRTYADDIVALMRERDIPRAVFIGTSLGVIVTMTLASRQPDRVAAAVLNDAGPEVPRQALDRIAAYAGKPVPEMTADEAIAYVESIGKVAYPGYGRDDWEKMARRLFRVGEDGRWVADYDPAVVRTTRPWLLRLLRPLLWRAYRRLASGRPVLVLRGQLSDVLDADVARRMAAVSGSARLVEVPGVGHAPDLSEPASRAAIHALLESAP